MDFQVISEMIIVGAGILFIINEYRKRDGKKVIKVKYLDDELIPLNPGNHVIVKGKAIPKIKENPITIPSEMPLPVTSINPVNAPFHGGPNHIPVNFNF